MGYRAKPRRIELRYPGDPELDGLEVTLRGQTLRGFLDILELTDVSEGLASQLAKFAESLVSWNLEDEDGQPVPATPEAVLEQDQELMLRLATDWINRLQGRVEAPLPESSPGGEPSPEASIPMEILSASPVSTAVLA